jgi:hypothetical protein
MQIKRSISAPVKCNLAKNFSTYGNVLNIVQPQWHCYTFEDQFRCTKQSLHLEHISNQPLIEQNPQCTARKHKISLFRCVRSTRNARLFHNVLNSRALFTQVTSIGKRLFLKQKHNKTKSKQNAQQKVKRNRNNCIGYTLIFCLHIKHV